MSDDKPPPAKRMCLRSDANECRIKKNQDREVSSDAPKYLTRNQAKQRSISIGNAELPTKRKVRKRSNNAIDLEDMNDHCLLEIMGNLHPFDLAKMAVMCKQFYHLAQYHFSVKYQELDYKSIRRDGLLDFEMAERIFRIFGHQILLLKMDRASIKYEPHRPNQLQLVSRYCTKVQYLLVDGLNINDNLTKKLIPLLNRIETLDIHHSAVDIKWDSLKAVKNLQLYRSAWTQWDALKLPRLKNLYLNSLNGIERKSLERFLNLNSTIKRLTIINCNGISPRVFGTIGLMHDLDRLYFEQCDNISDELFQTELAHLSSLHKLKRLTLDCNNHSVSRLLQNIIANGVALKYLHLINGPIDAKTYECVTKLKNIEVLMFNQMTTEIDDRMIIDIAKELKALRKFLLKTSHDESISPAGIAMMVQEANHLSHMAIDVPGLIIDQYTYERMLDTVQNRKKELQFEISLFYSNNERLLLSSDVINGPNKKWISMKTYDMQTLFPTKEWHYKPRRFFSQMLRNKTQSK